MQNSIPPKLLKEAKKCPKNFSCLKNQQFGDPIECKVDYIDGENFLFLKSNKNIQCPYRLSFGFGMVCQCPIHFYLYNKIYQYL